MFLVSCLTYRFLTTWHLKFMKHHEYASYYMGWLYFTWPRKNGMADETKLRLKWTVSSIFFVYLQCFPYLLSQLRNPNSNLSNSNMNVIFRSIIKQAYIDTVYLTFSRTSVHPMVWSCVYFSVGYMTICVCLLLSLSEVNIFGK